MQDSATDNPADLIREARQLVTEARGLVDALQGVPARAGSAAALISQAIDRLAVAGGKSSFLTLPREQLEALATALIQPGAKRPAILRQLRESTGRGWSRSSFYLFWSQFRSAYADVAGMGAKPARASGKAVAVDRAQLAAALDSLRREGRQNRLLKLADDVLLPALVSAFQVPKTSSQYAYEISVSDRLRSAIETALGEQLNNNVAGTLVHGLISKLRGRTRTAPSDGGER